ncbi:MAG: avidin/streptavidin family protein [Candidatus Pseudobacter hemicellulosilyticus]|uniref:Avidin/streptavidin family protein n=1 Tax=Candidatus Pseudobacter hemicellulosilyticus TaxID=3121375 RepID=A0AAJ5WXD3_9BACT|nr:MAG: avidin/streptavidin family protein [Pseudobacter sp.]
MNINGTWYNQLGSQMVLQVNGKNIQGTYHTKVGDASGIYELTGKMDIDNDASTAIGWVVLWNNQYGSSDSVTTWSGQIQEIAGEETIVTTWLLTAETEDDDNWHSTLVGKDVFTRLLPSKSEQENNSLHGVKSSAPLVK